MKPENYESVRRVITLLVMVVMGVAILQANLIIGFTSLLVGIFVMAILRRQVKGRVADERSNWLAQKASRVAFSLLVTILAFVSVLITFLGRKFFYLQSVGIIFSYVTCFALFLYLVCFHYFDRYYRGEDDEK